MTKKEITVFGIYADRNSLHRGLDAMRKLGFYEEHTSIVYPFMSHGEHGSTTTPACSNGLSAITTSSLRAQLLRLGVPKRQAERYEKRVTEGGFLLCVRSYDQEQVNNASVRLHQTGAEIVSSSE
jgi:hypothetical protein